MQKLTNLLLFVFDLNNLKYYNDKFGHDCGDQYITDAVHILQKVFSRYGKLYRIGGDEFCVLIDDHNTCDISHLISCLRKEGGRLQRLLPKHPSADCLWICCL